jgi:putative addiction module component (TIGR02574 family)
MDFQTLEQEVMNLPVSTRAKLAHDILQSLDTLSATELDALWLDEAEHRLKQLDSGLVESVSAEDVMGKAKALIR